ncbi:MAG: ABC transporter permease [Chloroflexi bacterium]|uniref:ABC transporter permease n=1 Tax=Candidatus Flexifilum breve TaxID=3140694 RepID=UPI003134E93E|nr:ABC transporter permease [Chloroflexota bacterium]
MATIDLQQAAIRPVDESALRSALSVQARPRRPHALSASLTLAWRALLKLRHSPMQLFDVTMFPVMMTLMFTFLFGGAIAGSVADYVQFLIPGISVMTVAMISMYTAMGLSTDIAKGIFDRFRSLSFWRPAVLVGALLGDAVRYTLAALVVFVLGFILGFRPEGGVIGMIAALAIMLVFAFSLSWIWTMIGLLIRAPESVMMVTSMASFPLTFASNIFVDPQTMPQWLQVVVGINPVTHTTTAVRGLMHGTANPNDIVAAFIACAALIVIFAPLTMYFYNTKNSR